MTDVASVNVSVGSFETLKVGITTWNVGNAQPLQSEVPLLLGGKDELSSLDMIVVGAQEATYKPVDEAKLVEKLAQKRGDGGRGSVLEDGKALEDHHHHAAQEHFYDILIAYCSKLGFSEVKRQSLGEMRLIVFAQEKHVKHISNVQTATAACGIAHMLKNKGGIIISLNTTVVMNLTTIIRGGIINGLILRKTRRVDGVGLIQKATATVILRF